MTKQILILGRVTDTVSLVISRSKIDKRAIASSSGIGNVKDSRVSQSGQFVTLSVRLCVQHDAREAERRAGPSATANTCLRPRRMGRHDRTTRGAVMSARLSRTLCARRCIARYTLWPDVRLSVHPVVCSSHNGAVAKRLNVNNAA